MCRNGQYVCAFRRILMIIVSALAMIGSAKADVVFGEPVNLGPPVNGPAHEGTPVLPADGLSLFFGTNWPNGNWDIWMTRRETTDGEWSAPGPLPFPINSSSWEGAPSISLDGLTLLFTSDRPGGAGSHDIWMTSRPTTLDAWTKPVNLGPGVNSPVGDFTACLSADGLELYFASERAGGAGNGDLWVTTRPTIADDWTAPVNLGLPVNSSADELNPSISSDGLRLLFVSGSFGSRDIWMTTRKSRDDEWGMPVNLGPPINGPGNDQGGHFSADGSILYFCSDRSGGYGNLDHYQVSVDPAVDLNGDGVVNAEDMSIMIHYWGQNESLCDIGPMPWGDGVVDVEDLIVLAEHLEPGLDGVAHWKLDEVEGVIAHDSIGGNDATVVGGGTWRPEDGLVGGALEFDGVDDHVDTGFVADPKAGAIRVVCWGKTDVAGGTIVSHMPGAPFGSAWLATDPADGTLVSDMMFPLPALHSTYVVADGQWHEVTAEWDGTYRRIWVDNHEVAKDAVAMTLPPFNWSSTLIIGAGPNLEPDSFFTGLIDDIRIYNRAVRP